MEGRQDEAEKIYLRVVGLTSREDHGDTVEQAIVLNDLGLAYYHTRQYAQAVLYLTRSLNLWERLRGPDDPNTALTMYSLALSYQEDGRGDAAEPLLKRALAVAETSFGARSLRTAEILSGYASFLRAHNRKREARKLEERAKSIAGTTNLPRVVDMTQLTIRSR
jgi:tetratricopeptide (TPR) repeat protein